MTYPVVYPNAQVVFNLTPALFPFPLGPSTSSFGFASFLYGEGVVSFYMYANSSNNRIGIGYTLADANGNYTTFATSYAGTDSLNGVFINGSMCVISTQNYVFVVQLPSGSNIYLNNASYIQMPPPLQVSACGWPASSVVAYPYKNGLTLAYTGVGSPDPLEGGAYDYASCYSTNGILLSSGVQGTFVVGQPTTIAEYKGIVLSGGVVLSGLGGGKVSLQNSGGYITVFGGKNNSITTGCPDYSYRYDVPSNISGQLITYDLLANIEVYNSQNFNPGANTGGNDISTAMDVDLFGYYGVVGYSFNEFKQGCILANAASGIAIFPYWSDPPAYGQPTMCGGAINSTTGFIFSATPGGGGGANYNVAISTFAPPPGPPPDLRPGPFKLYNYRHPISTLGRFKT